MAYRSTEARSPLPSPGVSAWLDPSAVVGGLIGVAGGLLVFWLGQRSAARAEREDASVRAAGELLVALAPLQERRPGGSDADALWISFRLSAAIHAPRLTDVGVRVAVGEVLTARERTNSRYYRKDLPKDEADGEWDQRRETLKAALDQADRALADYLSRAAAR